MPRGLLPKRKRLPSPGPVIKECQVTLDPIDAPQDPPTKKTTRGKKAAGAKTASPLKIQAKPVKITAAEAEKVAKPPAKRGGRKKKQVEETAQDLEADPPVENVPMAIESGENVKLSPKKRGRKKSSGGVANVPVEGEGGEKGGPSPQKRGRKKTPVVDAKAPVAGEGSENVWPSPPKRARKTTNSDVSAKVANPELVEKSAAKRGGKKAQGRGAQHIQDDPPMENAPVEAESEKSDPSPQKRGRKKTTKIPQAASGQEQNDEAVPEKKGRKKEQKPAAPAEGIETCAYEQLRAQLIKNRYEMLEKVGLINSKEVDMMKNMKETQSNRKKINRALTKRAREFAEPTRKSTRISSGPIVRYSDLDFTDSSCKHDPDAEYDSDDDDSFDGRRGKSWSSFRIDAAKFKWKTLRMDVPEHGRIHDHIPGIPVGQMFHGRYETHFSRIMSGFVRGIWADSKDAFCVILNGGYEDDFDLGEIFTYTGAGGRNLKGTKNKPKNLRTAPQSCDQTLTGSNLGLAMACQNKKPVRVLRGYKLDSQFAPQWGYRYDGLYDVTNYFEEVGKSGFKVIKYAFRRRADQDPPPWEGQEDEGAHLQDDGEELEMGVEDAFF